MPATNQEQPLDAAAAGVAGDKDPSRVVHTLVNELAKLGFLCWLIAWALSSMSAADSLFPGVGQSQQRYAMRDMLHRHQQVVLVEPAISRVTAGVRLLALESNN